MEPISHEAASTRRLIKRYSNRKLYDTQGSRYVTLLEIAEMVRSGEEVQIIDNATKEDKTEVTLALIISEELKERPRGIPISTLKALIRHRGERLLTTLRDGPIGRLIPREEPSEPLAHSVEDSAANPEAAPEDPPEVQEPETTAPASAAPSPPSLSALRRTLEQWQAAVDERIRAVLPHSNDVEELKLQVQAVNERLAILEERLRAVEKNPE